MEPATNGGFRPSLISWNLTKLCNLRCPHCYLEAGKKDAAELDTQRCLALVDEMAGLGTEMLILTGGEPLLRKDVFEIASAASSRGLWVVMGTNGVLIDDRVAARMAECGVKGVGISIDSIEAEKHDRFRGGPNSWAHSVRALDVCRQHGLAVLVQTTVMEENRDEIPQLLDFARERGAWSFNLYFLVRSGRGRHLHELGTEATEAMLTELVEAQERYKPMLVRSKCAPQFKRIAYEAGLAGLESGGCMAGVDYCRITPGGEVTPCPYMDLVAGNVREQSLTEVWRHSPVLRNLRDLEQLKGRCGACEYKELCGGCRCRAYAELGDYLGEDTACPHVPSGRTLDRDEVVWTEEARARLLRIPIAFIRGKVEKGIESYARQKGMRTITAELMQEGMQGEGRPAMAGMPDWAKGMRRPG